MSEPRGTFCLYKLRVHTGASFSGLRAGQLSRRVRASPRLNWRSSQFGFIKINFFVLGFFFVCCPCVWRQRCWLRLLSCCSLLVHVSSSSAFSSTRVCLLAFVPLAAYLAGAGPTPLPPWLVLPAPSGRPSRPTRQLFGSNRGKQTQVLLSR
jgi:hypothetical protein